MNPNNVWRLVAVIGGLIGTAGLAYGLDQHQKRAEEQRATRARLERIEADLASKDLELASLSTLLGHKNEQVRTLAAEVTRLRQKAAFVRRSA